MTFTLKTLETRAMATTLIAIKSYKFEIGELVFIDDEKFMQMNGRVGRVIGRGIGTKAENKNTIIEYNWYQVEFSTARYLCFTFNENEIFKWIRK